MTPCSVFIKTYTVRLVAQRTCSTRRNLHQSLPRFLDLVALKFVHEIDCSCHVQFCTVLSSVKPGTMLYLVCRFVSVKSEPQPSGCRPCLASAGQSSNSPGARLIHPFLALPRKRAYVARGPTCHGPWLCLARYNLFPAHSLPNFKSLFFF